MSVSSLLITYLVRFLQFLDGPCQILQTVQQDNIPAPFSLHDFTI